MFADAPPEPAEPARKLKTKGERTRRRLLEAAEQVFADLGYHEASIVKITEAAEVAQGTFYLYFSGKQAIFDELVEDLNGRVRHVMAEASGKGNNRLQVERLGFEAFFRFTAEHPALYRIIRQAEFVSPRMLRLHYERLAEGYIAELSRAKEHGEIDIEDPEVTAGADGGWRDGRHALDPVGRHQGSTPRGVPPDHVLRGEGARPAAHGGGRG